MKDNHNIKRGLEESVPSWDENLVWNGIEEALPPKKKRRYIFWLIAPLGLLFLFIVFNQFSENDTNRHSTQVSSESKEPQASPATTTSTSAPSEFITENTSQSTDRINEKKGTTTASQTMNNSLNNDKRNSKQIDKRIKKKPTESTRIKTKRAKNNSTKNLDLQTATLNTKTIASSKSEINSIQQSTRIADRNKKLSKSVDSLQKQINALLPLTSLSYSLKKRARTLPLPSMAIFQNSQKSKLVDQSGLEIWAGIYITQRNANGPLNWTKALNNQVDVKETFDLGVNYKKYFSNGLVASIGLSFSQIADVILHSRDTLLVTSMVESDSAIIVGGSFIPGTLTETTATITTTRTPNQYRSLLLPITLGYFIEKGQFLFKLSGGAEIKLYNNQRGRLLNTDLNVTQADQNDDLITRGIGLSSILLSSSIGYKLSDQWTSSIGLKYRVGLWDQYNPELHLVRFNNFGLRIGLERRF